MAKRTSRPRTLKAILFFVLIIVILGGAGLFYLGLNSIKEYSLEVNHRLTDADASSAQIQQLQVLKSQLSQSEALITKADKLFATPANYQAQALNDLRSYAALAGVSISATTFDDPAATGINSVTVKLSPPVNYKKLVQFLTLIEGNLPKMQVTSISLRHQVGGSADAIEVGDIKINISVR